MITHAPEVGTETAQAEARVRVRLLGGFEVDAGGAPLRFPTRKTEAVFAYLAFHAGTPARRDELVRLFWADRQPEQARNSLRQALTAIRHALQPAGADDLLESDRVLATLRSGAVEVDISAFEHAIRTGGPVEYAGELLAGYDRVAPAFDAWRAEQALRLRSMAIAALAERVAAIDDATSVAARDLAQHLLSLDPRQEAAHHLLVRHYTETGQAPLAAAQTALWRVGNPDRPDAPAAVAEPQPAQAALSVAVLPFINLSRDPDQDFFAAGLAEDLVTDLSKIRGLFVLSRNVISARHAEVGDKSALGRALGVAFLVEGSVRRAADRIRINVQLTDVAHGRHLWGERFDGDLAEIFDLQDEVVRRIVAALAETLPIGESAPRRRATSIEVYDLFVRGRVLLMQSLESNRIARTYLARAVELDPGFGEAHAWLAIGLWAESVCWGQPGDANGAMAFASAQRAIAIDPSDPVAHMILGFIRLYDGALEAAEAEFQTALRLNPAQADTWAVLADKRVFEGRPDDALDCMAQALRLNPHPPDWYYWNLGLAYYAARRYADAIETLRRDEVYRLPARRILAASLARLGREEEAREEARQFLAGNPGFTVQGWAATQPFRDAAMLMHFTEGYLAAGLPS